MHHSIRRLLRMGTPGILVWTVLIAVPPLARADTLPGGAIRALQQSQASRQSAPGKADMVTACQTQSALSATIDALRTRLQAARDTKEPDPDAGSPGRGAPAADSDAGVHARWHGRSSGGTSWHAAWVIRGSQPVLDGRLLRCALLLGLAWPVLGIGLGGRTAPVVSTLIALACPVSMMLMLMLWRMRRQRAGVQPSTHEQSYRYHTWPVRHVQHPLATAMKARYDHGRAAGMRRRSHARTAIVAQGTASR